MFSVLYSPVSPDEMDWRTLFPAFYPEKDDKGTGKMANERSAKVEFADIGCGYGGLLGNLFENMRKLKRHTVMYMFQYSYLLRSGCIVTFQLFFLIKLMCISYVHILYRVHTIVQN